jgi:cytochrome c
MSRWLLSLVLLIVFSAGVCTASDHDPGCRALVEKALAMWKEQGRDATLKAINDREGPFVKGELYVFAVTMDGTLLGQPHDRTLIGIDMHKMKDQSGKFPFQMFRQVAENPGSGWVDYSWAKPGEKDACTKRSYILRIPGEMVYLGAGYYVE